MEMEKWMEGEIDSQSKGSNFNLISYIGRNHHHQKKKRKGKRRDEKR